MQMDSAQNGTFSDTYVHGYNKLYGELLFADSWGEAEVAQLLAFIEIPSIPENEVTNSDDFNMESLEMWLGREDALSAIAERLDVGAPIEPNQKQVLIAALMEGVDQRESLRYFSAAVTRLIDSGLADYPGPAREKLISIYNSGDRLFSGGGVSVAENIERQLKARNAW